MKTLSVVLAASMICSQVGAQGIPSRFNYQARLTDSGGAPLSGNQTLYLSLYSGGTAGSAGSGTLVYKESASVTAVDGVVSHPLGGGTPLFGGPFSGLSLRSGGVWHLQVGVGSEGNVVLPRTRLEPAPFALVAANGPAGTVWVTAGTQPPAGYQSTGTLHAGGYWESKPAMPTPRRNLCAAALRSRIFAIGGRDYVGGPPYTTVEVFTPATNSWATSASLPTARFDAGAVTVGDRLYVIGGTGAAQTAVNAVEMFNPNTGGWTSRSPLPAPGSPVAAVTDGTRVYAVTPGGTYEYNPASNMWTNRAGPLYAPSAQFTAAWATSNRITLFAVDTPVQEYDIATNIWSDKGHVGRVGEGPAGAAVGDRVYLVWRAGTQSLTPQSTMGEYIPAANSWAGPPTALSNRSFAACAETGGKIYCLGGAGFFQQQFTVNLAEEFTPGGVFTLAQ